MRPETTGWRLSLGIALAAGSSALCILMRRRQQLEFRRSLGALKYLSSQAQVQADMPVPRFLKKAEVYASGQTGERLSVLVLGNGCAGAENQCMGLLRSLQLEAAGHYAVVPSFARVIPSGIWKLAPPFVHTACAGANASLNGIGIPDSARTNDGKHILAPPYPDVVIASGRTTAPACAAIKRASAGQSYTVQIQHPRVSEEHGTTILGTVGSLHDVGEEELQEAWNQQRDSILSSVRGNSLVAVLVGAPTSACPWKPEHLCAALTSIVDALDSEKRRVGLAITLSRRSGDDVQAAVEEWAQQRESVSVFDPRRPGNSPNPYLGLLAGAEVIVVTADSVAMASEASSSRKPVLTIAEHLCRGKLKRFHEVLREACGTQRAEEIRGPVAGVAGGDGVEALWRGRSTGLDDAGAVARVLLPQILAHCRKKATHS